MYCPKCGRKMDLLDGTLTCTAGNMPLSRHLQQLLLEAFPDENTPLKDPLVGAQLGRWFCPSCGTLLPKDKVCSSCGRSLTMNQVYNLVEFHPHLEEDGKGCV